MDPVEYNTIQGVRGGIPAAKTRDGEICVSPARTGGRGRAGPGQVIGGRGGHWWAGGGTCHWWAGPRAGRGRSLVGGTEGEAGEQTLVGGGGAGRTGHLWAGPRAGLGGGRLLVGGAGPAPEEPEPESRCLSLGARLSWSDGLRETLGCERWVRLRSPGLPRPEWDGRGHRPA